MRKGDQKKHDILKTAESLFYRNGYAATGIQDILDELRCSKGSFYHHFTSKIELLEAIAQMRVEATQELFEAGRYSSDEKTLNALLYSICPFRRGEELFLQAVLQLDLSESAILNAAVREAETRLFYPRFAELVRRMSGKDEARSLQEEGVEAVWQACQAAFSGWAVTVKALFPTGQAAQKASRMLNALRNLMETALDLPYGSVKIIELSELTDTLRYGLEQGQYAIALPPL